MSSIIEPNSFDPQAAKDQIKKLESIPLKSLEQNEELAHLYVSSAVDTLEKGGELKAVILLFDKAEDVLLKTLKQGEDDEIRRFLGNVYLNRAVAYNDYDELEDAVKSYGAAIDVLKPLDEKADGEAKYDLAGIRLNRGTIYHELGDYEKAKADLDESFLAFRAVEKIANDIDTRYYMARVSVAQGGLMRDMDEPQDKVVDAYNRAMRLFVELIDVGQTEHERELANTLLDRCIAVYDDYKEREFGSEQERLTKYGDVLVDVGRAVEILERVAEGGGTEERFDLFTAITTQGAMLLDIEKFEDAYNFFNRAVNEFADFADSSSPLAVNHYAGALENRGFCETNIGKFDEALVDINKAIALRQTLQSPKFGLDDDAKGLFAAGQATAYANLANVYAAQGDKETARKSCRQGLDLLKSLNDDSGEFSEIAKMFEEMLKQWEK
ncbi:MAG: tetratricopeptide repeat protein [Planctomycetaceae bacterium]|jgi:tetratricopeptide (TPR) repeat protein|nr:tetratricopeptide repeat protein [Planctomycetaceae bacterium]